MQFQIIPDKSSFVGISQGSRPAATVTKLTENNQGVGGISATPEGSAATAHLIVLARITIHGHHDIERCVAYAEYLSHASKPTGWDLIVNVQETTDS